MRSGAGGGGTTAAGALEALAIEGEALAVADDALDVTGADVAGAAVRTTVSSSRSLEAHARYSAGQATTMPRVDRRCHEHGAGALPGAIHSSICAGQSGVASSPDSAQTVRRSVR